MEQINKTVTTNEALHVASLELCDAIVDGITRAYDTVELCESIVADIELRAIWESTIVFKARKMGMKVRFESKTLHD